MFALNITGAERVEIVERRRPRVVEDSDAIVRVTTSAIGPRDLARFSGAYEPGRTIPGSEFCGFVDEVGGDVTSVDLGDLVTSVGIFDATDRRQAFGWDGLDGAQALYVRVPLADQNLVKVPTAALEERALLLGDTYGLGASAARIAAESRKGNIGVLGCDPYGASALIALVSDGADNLIALDGEERRRGLAHRLGATAIDVEDRGLAGEVSDATRGELLGALVLGAGVSTHDLNSAIKLVHDSGLVVFTEPEIPGWTSPPVAPERGISFDFAVPPTRSEISDSMLKLWGGSLDLGPLVSHVMPIVDAERGYEQLHRRERGAHKILLKM